MTSNQTIPLNQYNRFDTVTVLWMVLPSIVVLIFNLVLFNRYFPLSEGWWETYGYLLNKGLIPYRDFNVEFPLLFVFINKWALKYLPESFFLYRLLGVFVQLLIVGILQISLGRFFSRKTAAVATLFAMILVASNPIFIAKDYHSLVDLNLTFVFFVTSLIYVDIKKGGYSGIRLGKVLLLGFLIALLALVKQNVGAFVFLSYVVTFFSLPGCQIKTKLFLVVSLVSGFAVGTFSYLLFLLSQNVPFDSIVGVFLKNDSKGPIAFVLFRFILDKSISRLIGAALFVTAAFLAVVYSSGNFLAWWAGFWKDSAKANAAALVLLFFLFSVAVVTKGLALTVVIIPLSLAILMLVVLRFYFFRDVSEEGIPLLAPTLIALVYCNTHTAGLNFPGMFFVILFTSAFAFEYIISSTSVKPAILAGLLLSPTPFLIFNKMYVPYDWWGLKQSTILDAKFSLPYPQARGILVDDLTRDAFFEISSAINKFSKTNSDVLLFPDIPVFYYLHGKLPPYKNLVQWFDVIGSKKIEQEFVDCQSAPPALVVFLDPPDSVYQGHLRLLHRELTQIRFRTLFENLVDDGKYVAYKYSVYNKEKDDLYKPSNRVNVRIRVRNKKYFHKSAECLYKDLAGTSGLEIKSLVHNGVNISFTSNTLISENDELNIETDKRNVKTVSDAIGYLVGSDYYTLKIYVRKDAFK